MDDRPATALLRLLAFLSPAFPTGGFAYSHGLEWAVEAQDVTNEATLHAWIDDLLRHGAGRNDAVLLRLAYAASPASLATLAHLAAACAPAAERRVETVAMGSAFSAAAAVWKLPSLPPGCPYPVAVAAAAAASGISDNDAVLGYLQAWAASLVSAGVRLIPLGQSAGRRVLAALEPTVIATASATRGCTEADLGAACFRSDIAAMRHETQRTRLFRT